MAKRTRRWSWAGLGGAATLLAWGGNASAAPTVAQILGFAPRQPGVECTTPGADQHASCKVNLVKGRKGSGWAMTDASGQPLRRFYDSNDDNKIDIWSFFKDGVEVYREVDANLNGKPDQYRWLHSGGSRWGVDVNEDGRIDSWKVITPEEVSQEVLQAVVTGDYVRLQAILVTEAEIKALELSTAEADKLRASLKEAQAKFNQLSAKLKGMEKVNWLHLETTLPQTRPADAVGSRYDFIYQQRGTVIFESGGKNDWIHTGQMVKVGDAWRLAEGPSHGSAAIETTPAAPGAVTANPKLQKKVEELTEMEKTAPPSSATPGPNEALVKYNLKRADLLEQIIAEVPAKERDLWYRQLGDCLGTALQNSGPKDRAAEERLAALEKLIVGSFPDTPLAAYVVYRHMNAAYSSSLYGGKETDYAKIQANWIDSLAKFVEKYPRSEDAADALVQLGMTCEINSKEADAKKWYTQLARDFGDKTQGMKGRGALKRLASDGKAFELAGRTLDAAGFDMAQVRGKVVVVYYWASWNQSPADDLGKLKKLVQEYGSKGLEVVCVNCDSTEAEARALLGRSPAPGVCVRADGGLESSHAMDYGVLALPHLFLVGKDGKVVSRNVQLLNLEDEVKKLLK
jgi:thiol-disulfide isomerase/thioredoxin